MDNITALVLAGGISERFWPLSHKSAFPIMGKPFLQWHFEQLLRCGVRHVIVVTNKGNNTILKEIPIPKDLHIEYTKQEGKGLADAVFSCKTLLKDTPVIILNASDWYDDAIISDLVDHIHDTHPDYDIAVGAKRVHEYFPGGYLVLNARGNVTSIIEKPKQGEEPSDLVDIVSDIVQHPLDFCSYLSKFQHNAASGYEEAKTAYIKAGHICKPLITSSHWMALKYPWHVLSLMEELLGTIDGQHIDSTAQIKKNVIIEGPVIIEKNVMVSEGTKIVGPCYIGQGSIIGNNNLIRYSHIGSGCVTGFSTDITRSYIGSECWFHSNYIGDSVITNNVSLGSGTVLANLRLDEGEISSFVKGEKIVTGKNKLGAIIGEYVRIGVNVSIMPGVKIGKNTFISSGAVLQEDIPEEKFVKTSCSYSTVDNKRIVQRSRKEFKDKLS